jgi:hypothetical protein
MPVSETLENHKIKEKMKENQVMGFEQIKEIAI